MGKNRFGENQGRFYNNQNNSRFSPSGRPGSGMNMNRPFQDQDDFYGSPSNYNKNYGSSGNNSDRNYSNQNNTGYNQNNNHSKTPEQLAFDEEFAKWEKSFEGWRREFANRSNTAEFKEYERKFLDVRDKLLEKRKQIYRQRSFANEFENQLSAADAMAKSILSKFDDGRSNQETTNRSFNNANMSRNTNIPSTSSNIMPTNDMSNANLMTILQLAQGLSQVGSFNNSPMQRNPDVWAYGGPYVGMGNRGGNRNMAGRGAIGGSSRQRGRYGNNLDKRGINKRDNSRNPIGFNKNKKKSVNDRLEKKATQVEVQVPIAERIKALREEAEKVECPKLMSGSLNRKLKLARDKKHNDPQKLTEEDNMLLEFHSFLTLKRYYYRQKRNKEREESEKKLEENENKDMNEKNAEDEKMDESTDITENKSTIQQDAEKSDEIMEEETSEQVKEDTLPV